MIYYIESLYSKDTIHYVRKQREKPLTKDNFSKKKIRATRSYPDHDLVLVLKILYAIFEGIWTSSKDFDDKWTLVSKDNNKNKNNISCHSILTELLRS